MNSGRDGEVAIKTEKSSIYIRANVLSVFAIVVYIYIFLRRKGASTGI